MLICWNGLLYLEDLGSFNGIYIRIKGDVIVFDGDLFLMGLVRLNAALLL